MFKKSYSAVFFATLLGTTLCVIPEGEIQIGPIFGQGSRFFGNGHKHFEAVFHKGADLKPLLAKKAIIGAGVLGAGALAAGGGLLLAKKFPHLTHGWGWKGHESQGYGYGQGQQHQQGYYNNYNTIPQSSYGSAGWGQESNGFYQSPIPSNDHVTFPSSSYPTPSSSYGTSTYPSTSYGYPQTQSEWQGSDSYGGSYGGWAR